MASIRKRVRKDGTPSFQVMWRETDGTQASVTFLTEPEAITLRKALDANGGDFAKAQEVILPVKTRPHTVAEVCQEHIDTLIKPIEHTINNYRGYLNNHIRPHIGGVPVDQLKDTQITAWVRGLMNKKTGKNRTMSPVTIAKIVTFLSSAMETAVTRGYRPNNPCTRVDLPSVERAGEDMLFLTVKEFNILRAAMDAFYRVFISFLVMTGVRFGEATAVTVGDVNLSGPLATVRINKAWKTDGGKRSFVGPPKNPSSRRTIAIPAILAEMLKPLIEGRPTDALLFVDKRGGRIKNEDFYRNYWVPARDKAHEMDETFVKPIKPHGLRHTHASWLIQEGVDLFKIARRLGHANTSMIDKIYGHLMPDAQIESATAIGKAMMGELSEVAAAQLKEIDPPKD